MRFHRPKRRQSASTSTWPPCAVAWSELVRRRCRVDFCFVNNGMDTHHHKGDVAASTISPAIAFLFTRLRIGVVCEQCGYALYRTSTRTTRRQIKYYRCLGSDRYRHLRGPACSCRPIRQDYLDDLVWQEVLRLLRTPQLIQAELERRRTESLNSSAVQHRQEQVSRELTRLGQQMDKLLDAYQEGLMTLAELRKRSPEIKKKIGVLETEQQHLNLRAIEDKRWIELNNSLETFLGRLNETAQKMAPAEKQKVLRTMVKQITVGKDLITIHHSIPVGAGRGSPEPSSYSLCTRGPITPAGEPLPSRAGQGTGRALTLLSNFGESGKSRARAP